MTTLPQSPYKTTTWKGDATRQIFISSADGDLSAGHFNVCVLFAIADDVVSGFSDSMSFTHYTLPLGGKVMLIKGRHRTTLSHNTLHKFEGDEKMSLGNTQGAVDFSTIVRHGISVGMGIMTETQFTDSR